MKVSVEMRAVLKNTLARLGLLESLKRCIYISYNSCHLIREVIYRAPNPVIRIRQYLSPPSHKQLQAILELQHQGIVVLEDYLSSDRLKEIKEDFENFVKTAEKNPPGPMKQTPDGGLLHPRVIYSEEGYDVDSLVTSSTNPYKHGQGFLKLAVDNFILGVIAGYMGKHFMLQHAVISRYYPSGKTNFGSWQWHHDSWGRKINVMVLLTDVTEKDQYMSYMKGSQKIYHSLERTSINDRFTEDEVKSLAGLQEFHCLGKAGTVFIFDSNGLHRGNRSLGATRDSLITNYTAGRYIWGFNIPERFVRGLTLSQRKFLMRNKNIKIVN